MGERPAEFLFDWEKESRGKGEHRKPQSCDRGKLLVATKRRGSHPKKCVGCNPGDDEANGNKRPGRNRRRRRGGRRGKKPHADQQQTQEENAESADSTEGSTPEPETSLEPVGQAKPGIIAWILRFLGLK